jgi:hypothetical protein
VRGGDQPVGAAWRTCRDAFAGLGEPSSDAAASGRGLSGVGKQCPGHTGGHIDGPSKALKAGVHGVPGGENMLMYYNGTTRHFTTREAARLQGMPDIFRLSGSWSQAMRRHWQCRAYTTCRGRGAMDGTHARLTVDVLGRISTGNSPFVEIRADLFGSIGAAYRF